MGEKQGQKLGFPGVGSFIKRKRTASETPVAASSPKKARSDESRSQQDHPQPCDQESTPHLPLKDAAQAATVTSVPSVPRPTKLPRHPSSASTAAHATSHSDMTPLQQIIENELNMQMLMKHNELRLIEQELAKCQVALEQLRRCELKPFPGNETSAFSEAVSNGTGSAVGSPGFTQPAFGPAYGVADGPYTKHYRQWLIPDAQFDSVTQAQAAAEAEALAHAFGRSTRYNGTARKSIAKPFSRHESLVSLSNYSAPAPAKDKNQPQFLRRSTDGALVKLVCNNCHRWNFSSIQGFLNHCRIAHKVDYKSHDAAAIDCGQIPDEQEVAALPPETQSTPAPKPAVKLNATPVTIPAPPPTVIPPLVKGQVHPLNTTAGAQFTIVRRENAAVRAPAQPLSAAPAASFTSTPFTSSSQVPRLSALFAKNGFGGDLEKAAVAAKQRIDFSVLEDDALSPGCSDPTSPAGQPSGARNVASTVTAMERTKSGKSYSQATHQHRRRPAPLTPASAPMALVHEIAEIPESPHESTVNLSPHTADSAPGLVSDNDDDDHGSASEDEAPHDPALHPPIHMDSGGCTTGMELDVAVEDDMDGHGLVIRRTDMVAHDDRAIRASGSPSRKLATGSK